MYTIDKSWLLFLGVFALVGLVCSGIAWALWNKNRYIKASGIGTTGLIINHHRKWQPSPNQSTALAVVVQYTDWQSQPRVYYSTTYTTPVLFQVGETIQLWYLKDKPDEILMEGKDEWLIPLVLAGFGLVFSLIGLPGLLKALIKVIFQPAFGR